jgi:hypothetical protein
MKIQMSTRLVILAIAPALVLGVGFACSSSSNPSPTGGGTTTLVTGSSSSSGSSSGSTSSSSGTSSSGGSSCYDGGTPMMNSDFLNPCEPAGTTCVTFTGTIQGLSADGGLPALP